MHVHQISSFQCYQCVSLNFHESYSYLMIFCASISDIKLSKGVFSYNSGMEHLVVQSVFNEHQCMFINSHLSKVDQYVSLIFNENYSYLMIICANMSDIEIMKRSVFIKFWYGKCNGAICF